MNRIPAGRLGLKRRPMFIQELAAELAAAEAGAHRPDLSEYEELRDGEEVVGTISNPSLLAFIAVSDSREKQFYDRWPKPPGNLAEAGAMLPDAVNLKAVKDAVWHEVQNAFSLNVVPAPHIGIRKTSDGALVVAKMNKAKLPRHVLSVGISGPFSLAEVFGGDCGNPDCEFHHPKGVS